MRYPYRLLCPFIVAAAAILLTSCESAPEPRRAPPPAASIGPLPPPPPGVFELSELDTPPRAVRQRPPTYPFTLRRAGISGEAQLLVIVGPDGAVHDIRVLSATDPAFAAAAIDCVHSWAFQPAQRDGQPVPCRLRIPIVFSLNER